MDIMPVPKLNGVAVAAPTALSPQEVAQNREVVQAVRAINEAGLLGNGSELTFVRDPQTHKFVARIVDRNTGEVLREVPPESVLQSALHLRRPG